MLSNMRLNQSLCILALLSSVQCFAQALPTGPKITKPTMSDDVIEPIDISKNPYRLKGHAGILDNRRVPLLVGDGTMQYAPYPGGNLRFSQMIDEHTAAYQVLVGREDVYPDGEIVVVLPDSTPPDSNRLWRVAVVGPTKVVNGLGNTIVVCEVKFLGYYDPPPQPSSATTTSISNQATRRASAPILISSVEPELTDAARQAKVNMNVLVKIVVDATGKPTQLHVDKPVGYGLEQKAIEAVSQYKFKPAMEDGVAVPVGLNVEVNFQTF